MSLSCRSVLLLLSTGPLTPACTFEDPNAPPPPDICLAKSKRSGQHGLWAMVDGPPSCATTNPTRPEGDDTLIHYTGSGWDELSAHCRARDIFLGAVAINDPDLDGDDLPEVTVERDFARPLDAIGYCLINARTPSELTVYSTCGEQSAGQAACEELLPRQSHAEITTTWFNCPGGSACAPASHDACLARAGDGRAYAAFVDDPDFYCAGTPHEPILTDAQDSLLIITGTRYNQSSAICTATSVYDSKAGLAFGIGPMSRISTRDADHVPILDPARHPVPNGLADGYCLFNQGLAEEFVLYSLCSGLAPVSAVDGGVPPDGGGMAAPPTKTVLSRQERCAGYREKTLPDGGVKTVSAWGDKVSAPRHGEWVTCPGGPLCTLPLK